MFVELVDLVLNRRCIGVGSYEELVALGDRALGCGVAILDINLGPSPWSGIDAYTWLREKGCVLPRAQRTEHALLSFGVVRSGRGQPHRLLVDPAETCDGSPRFHRLSDLRDVRRGAAGVPPTRSGVRTRRAASAGGSGGLGGSCARLPSLARLREHTHSDHRFRHSVAAQEQSGSRADPPSHQTVRQHASWSSVEP
jgi:hypothetical protein